MQTFGGSDTATLRMRSLGATSVGVHVEEEDSRDSERTHATEDVGFAALYDNPFSYDAGSEGAVYGTGDAYLEMGRITNLNHNLQTVNLAQDYVNPIVILGTLSFNGGDPSTVRVKDVTANSFAVQIQEWSYRDVWHTTEEISWMVVEAGHYTFPDGTVYDAGAQDIGADWEAINFMEAVPDAVVFS